MKISLDPSLRSLVAIAALGLTSTACIINATDDDSGGLASSDDGTNPPVTGTSLNTTGSVTAATTDSGSDGGSTTEGPPDNCSANVINDPGFESGSPSRGWNEASDVFGTPICDAACTNEKGADPYAGDWWVWFGGVEDEPETASVSQDVTIAPDTALLTFWFQIRSGALTGDDVFTVELDGQTIFMVTDLEMDDYSAYTQVEVDVSDWADGGTYELILGSSHAGTGLSSFFVDEVSLVSCTDESATDSGTTAAQDSTGGSDSGSTGDTDGTTTGGASSSGGSTAAGDAG